MACCVLEMNKKSVVLSVNPRLVNARLTASDFHPNMVGEQMVVGRAGMCVSTVDGYSEFHQAMF